MKEIPLPQKIQIEEKDNKNATIIIEPLYPGYGLTIGNALRRTLISSLAGAAVTAIKIKNVKHEFSTIPYVKEDMVDIILNIKLLRLKLLQGDSATITLKVKGEKIVTPKDIKTASNVEIVNPELKIATLTDKSAELEIEFIVGSGLGYSPVESREKDKLEIGMIAIDAIFTPILKARFEIENVRVGQVTNFDRLTLEIETDGTMSPFDAFKQASQILVGHFSLLSEIKKIKKAKKEEKEEKEIVESHTEKETEEKPARGWSASGGKEKEVAPVSEKEDKKKLGKSKKESKK